MKLPAVAIAAAFGSGIALGLHPVVARHASSLAFLALSFVTVAFLVATGIVLLQFGRVFPYGDPSPEFAGTAGESGWSDLQNRF